MCHAACAACLSVAKLRLDLVTLVMVSMLQRTLAQMANVTILAILILKRNAMCINLGKFGKQVFTEHFLALRSLNKSSRNHAGRHQRQHGTLDEWFETSQSMLRPMLALTRK